MFRYQREEIVYLYKRTQGDENDDELKRINFHQY